LGKLPFGGSNGQPRAPEVRYPTSDEKPEGFLNFCFLPSPFFFLIRIVPKCWAIICGLLPLVFNGVAFAQGAYQRTKDGKTMVWNSDPKPGDVATWFGDRDAEGYATKVGTLTWYMANGAGYVRYFGNMVRGKFDGMVNSHSKGKTDHAIFADGQRITRWMAGRAPSWRVAQQKPSPVKPPVKIAKATSGIRQDLRHPTSNVRSESVREQPVQPRTKEVAATGLSERQTTPATPPPAAKPSSPEDVSHRSEPEPPAEGPRGAVETGRSTPSPLPSEQPSVVTSKDIGEQETKSATEEKPSIPSQPLEESTPNPPTGEKSGAEADDSLKSLARPPSSLHPLPATTISPEASPRLTKEEVVNIANAEARARGYDRADFHRAEPQFNATYRVWSVSYGRDVANELEEGGEDFKVIVDDKTKGVVFERRR
jgi:hypothetical protein